MIFIPVAIGLVGVGLVGAGRSFLKTKVENAVIDGIRKGNIQAKNQIEEFIHIKYRSSLAIVIYNVLAIILAVYAVGLVFGKYYGIFAVCCVYIVSSYCTCKSIISMIPHIKTAILIQKKMKRFSLKELLYRFLYDEVYKEVICKVRREYDNMAWYEKIFNSWFGKPAHEVADEITKAAVRDTFKLVSMKIVHIVVFVTTYIVVFRLVVAPIMIQDVTSFTLFQAFICPFFYAFDFFLNEIGVESNLVSWLFS